MTPAIPAGLKPRALTDPKYQGHEVVLDVFRDVAAAGFVGPHAIHGVGIFDFLDKPLNWPKLLRGAERMNLGRHGELGRKIENISFSEIRLLDSP